MKRRVTIEEARKLQHEGYWKPNPKYDPKDASPHAEPEKVFVAKYIVHMRPERDLPEPLQYAYVEEA